MTLAKQEEQPVQLAQVSPKEHIAYFTEVATALSEVVEKQGLYSIISGKKFPKAEAWQTVVSLDGSHPITDWIKPMYQDDTLIGYEAKVSIVKHGEVIASGIMPCGFDDFPCKGKTGVARDRACQSSAQTWAGAKAARMKYAWVVVLAGFEATPAEEMEGTTQTAPDAPKNVSQRAPDPALGSCPVHNVPWLLNKNGRRYHRAGEGWCNFSAIQANLLKELVNEDRPDWGPAELMDWITSVFGVGWKEMTDPEHGAVLDKWVEYIAEGQVGGVHDGPMEVPEEEPEPEEQGELVI